MNILAVDTAGKTAGVALLQDDRLLYEVYLDAGMTHSETLMPMIDTCLKTCGMTCADIDLYGVNAGPGSFTGPTFAIVNYYRGPRPLAHFDLYRISTENDLCAAGFYDYLDQGAIVAAEWSENFADLLALEQPIHVNIERVDENTRKITIEGVEV